MVKSGIDKWKIIGPLITIVLVGLGFAGSWFTQKATVESLEKDQKKIEQKVENHEKDITELRIKDAQDTEIINNIGTTLNKIEQQTRDIPQIKADLDVIKRRPR
jgi:Tfp pilus assembly protein PilO